MKEKDKCYWCGQVATSREHIPPRGLFGEVKGQKQLITVPSCCMHNERKSELDSYFVATIGGMFAPQNEEQLKFANGKLKRMAEHYGGSLNSFLGGEECVIWAPGLNFSGGVISEIDMGKMSVSLEGIARGLWYHLQHDTFMGELILFEPIFPNISYAEGQPPHFDFSLNAQKCGDCPNVFWYQFLEKTDLTGLKDEIQLASTWENVSMLNMCFFDSIKATAIFNNSGSNHFIFIQSDDANNILAYGC